MISILPIPIFNDNYVWLIEHKNGDACVVDPGDAEPVQKVLEARGLNLTSILVTHHHWDHIGGIEQLVAAYQDVDVYGPNSNKIPQITHIQQHDDNINLFGDLSLSLKIIAVPGHTSEHIAYFAEASNSNDSDQNDLKQPILFCGDTLFAGGCGRLLGGTAEQLFNSLKTLSTLATNTQVYCTHEYTLANLAFANAVEPSNELLKARANIELIKRDNGIPTLPSTIELEQQTNPFLRCAQAEVKTTINRHWKKSWQTEQQLFTGLRLWKDNF
jgi:hydroxyacylglutathione hydrolase